MSLKKLATLMDIGHGELAKISQRNIRTIERVHPSTDRDIVVELYDPQNELE